VACARAAAIICGHLAAVLVLPHIPALRASSAAHKLSAAMGAGCALSTAAVFFWARVFYLSKVYELSDTRCSSCSPMCYVWLATRQS